MITKKYQKIKRVDLTDDEFVSFFASLISKKRVAIRGVGKFFVRKVAPRKTYNNFSDKTITTKSRFLLKFKAFDTTTDLLNERIK